MADAPSDEVVDDINQGNEPTSLGDVAEAGQDPVVGQSEDIGPDPQHIQEQS
ncbi:MAG TPA: hypothetical protein VHI31_01420 [Actinomycetota bacterium]|nr:hypothetical protein [Actinomycetota bacterium]